MGAWSADVIKGDSTLKFSMDLLTAAWIGPANYAERRKTFKVVMKRILGGLWIGRHEPEEYLELFATLDAAAGKGMALLASLPNCFALVNEV